MQQQAEERNHPPTLPDLTGSHRVDRVFGRHKGNILLFPRDTDRHREGPVRCRERLGGLLRYYYREAA
jgi:hypothetical protein